MLLAKYKIKYWKLAVRAWRSWALNLDYYILAWHFGGQRKPARPWQQGGGGRHISIQAWGQWVGVWPSLLLGPNRKPIIHHYSIHIYLFFLWLASLSWNSPTHQLEFSKTWVGILQDMSWYSPTQELEFSSTWVGIIQHMSWNSPTHEMEFSNTWVGILWHMSCTWQG